MIRRVTACNLRPASQTPSSQLVAVNSPPAEASCGDANLRPSHAIPVLSAVELAHARGIKASSPWQHNPPAGGAASLAPQGGTDSSHLDSQSSWDGGARSSAFSSVPGFPARRWPACVATPSCHWLAPRHGSNKQQAAAAEAATDGEELRRKDGGARGRGREDGRRRGEAR